MHNLNPNLVLQIAVFIALCEGYLGIKPNFALWKYYFCATIFLKIVWKGETVRCTSVAMRSSFVRAGWTSTPS
jgi:hypothetical protein